MEDKALLIYLDDDNAQKTVHVTILEERESSVKFLTLSNDSTKNEITIPMHRIIKIKRRVRDNIE